MSNVALPDRRTAQYWQGGAPDGPVVFFFHGTPDCRVAAYGGGPAGRRTGVRLIAVNRPGYGRSDPYPSDHTTVAADTVAVADALGVGRFAVLGMSLGGPYALACAARYPDRVAGAGVVAAPAPAERTETGTVAEVGARIRPEFEAYRAGMVGDDATLAARYRAHVHPLDVPYLAALSDAEVAAGVRESLARSDGYLRDAAVTFRPWTFEPGSVRCPTHLWYGGHDDRSTVHNGQWYASRIPGSTLAVREDTAHLGTLFGYWDEILAALRFDA